MAKINLQNVQKVFNEVFGEDALKSVMKVSSESVKNIVSNIINDKKLALEAKLKADLSKLVETKVSHDRAIREAKKEFERKVIKLEEDFATELQNVISQVEDFKAEINDYVDVVKPLVEEENDEQ